MSRKHQDEGRPRINRPVVDVLNSCSIAVVLRLRVEPSLFGEPAVVWTWNCSIFSVLVPNTGVKYRHLPSTVGRCCS